MRRAAPTVLAALMGLGLAACSDDETKAEFPQVEFAPERLYFGPVFVGQGKDLALRLANTGRVTAHLSVAVPAGYLVDAPTLDLAPGSKAAVTVTFVPPAAGDLPGELRISGDAELEVPLAGRGIEFAYQLPYHLRFGPVLVGSRATLPLPVENTSEGAIRVELEPGAGDRDAFEFPASAAVPAGGRVEVPVVFAPRRLGEFAGEVRLRACASCEERVVELGGEGVEVRHDVHPDALDFGILLPGERATRSVRLTNSGSLPIGFAAANLVQGPAVPFSLGGPPSWPVAIEPGAAVEVAVTYAPLEPGETTSTLRLALGASTVDVPLSGRAYPPLLVAAPPVVEFGVVPPGSQQARTVVLSAATELAATVEEVRLDSGSWFSVAPSRDLPAAVGEPLAVEVRLDTAEEGARETTLLVSSLPDGRELAIPVTAIVRRQQPCTLELAPEELRFGLIRPGEVARREAILRNAGAADCPVWDFRLEPGTPASYSLPEPPGTVTLPPGGELPVAVEYAPPVAQLHADYGALLFQAYPPSSPPVRVPLSGMATGLVLAAEPDPLEFGAVPVGATEVRSFTVRNHGELSVRLHRIGLSQDASVDFALEAAPEMPSPLAAGAAATAHVSYAPGEPGADRGEMEVWLEDVPQPLLASVSGSGVDDPCGEACTEPRASCPAPRTARVHEVVSLVGAGLDPDGGPVSCTWTVREAPAGSTAAVEDPASCSTTFRPDRVGAYTLVLLVEDDDGDTASCATEVEAVPLPPFWVEATWSADDDVDLHLFHPLAGDPSVPGPWFDLLYDCHFGNPAPYWDRDARADDPFLDVDDRHRRGPESIRLEAPSTEHAYTVAVHWFESQHGNRSQAVTTRIYCGGELVAEVLTDLEFPTQAAVVGTVRFTSPTACLFTAKDTLLTVVP